MDASDAGGGEDGDGWTDPISEAIMRCLSAPAGCIGNDVSFGYTVRSTLLFHMPLDSKQTMAIPRHRGESRMGYYKIALAGFLAVAAAGASAGVDVNIGIGIPAPVVVQPAPVYVPPPPVYVAPRPVYAPRPVVVVPPPVYAPAWGYHDEKHWRKQEKRWRKEQRRRWRHGDDED